MLSRDFTEAETRKLEFAFDIVCSYFPHLAGIFSAIDIRFDPRIETSAVTPSGKLLFNRDFFQKIGAGMETAFILAHELLHLSQMTFERGNDFEDRESLNIAHDFLINALLCVEMGFAKPPCGGLSLYDFWQQHKQQLKNAGIAFCPDASQYSLEEMVRIVVSLKSRCPGSFGQSWSTAGETEGDTAKDSDFSNNPFADMFKETPAASPEERNAKITLDMIWEKLEKSLFPGETVRERKERMEKLAEACRDAATKNLLVSTFEKFNGGYGRGCCGGDSRQEVEIIRSCYSPPWQMAMQRWFDGVASSKRSWARASRRGAWRSDVVLPGRSQECFTVHVILDTSGSMANAIPVLLGHIAAFARVVGMEQVHILQCDTSVTSDEFVDIERLARFDVAGYGGSDMSPAMLKLAEDPQVTHVLIITDGCINYPKNESDIPYEVLWCVPDGGYVSFPYGKVIRVPLLQEA